VSARLDDAGPATPPGEPDGDVPVDEDDDDEEIETNGGAT
jgi:hypothetical protein